MYVNYMGISKVRANNGKTYEVIDITMTILDDAFTNQKDALKASLTNDINRIPIIIDTSLNIGSVRAVMKSVKGARH
jgi:5-methylcytosine-specific restriction endonuclease McrBC GTP-binding regulatory subunit McrB